MKFNWIAAAALVSTTALAQNVSTNVANFTFPQPSNTSQLEKLSLWGTWYFLPQMNVSQGAGEQLFGPGNVKLNIKLAHRDYCVAAMEGSVRIRNGESNTTYNWAGKAPDLSVDCTDVFKNHPNSGKIFWRIAYGPFGDGADRGEGLLPWMLIPFRTLAVDPTVIPFETVLYIPAAKGVQIKLPDGRTVKHDGYFIAADRGTAIKNTHVDVFIGTATSSPFDFVTSSANDTFSAYIVNDPTIEQQLRLASTPE